MEKYQRNIFGFSFKTEFFSFENLLTILLTLVFGLAVIVFMIQILTEIGNQKLDVIRSTGSIKDYKSIGSINIMKDTVLMPVIEIKIRNITNIQ